MSVIPFTKPIPVDEKCSFCGIPKSKAKNFFTNGSGHAICDQCVIHAKQRLEETNECILSS